MNYTTQVIEYALKYLDTSLDDFRKLILESTNYTGEREDFWLATEVANLTPEVRLSPSRLACTKARLLEDLKGGKEELMSENFIDFLSKQISETSSLYDFSGFDYPNKPNKTPEGYSWFDSVSLYTEDGLLSLETENTAYLGRLEGTPSLSSPLLQEATAWGYTPQTEGEAMLLRFLMTDQYKPYKESNFILVTSTSFWKNAPKLYGLWSSRFTLEGSYFTYNDRLFTGTYNYDKVLITVWSSDLPQKPQPIVEAKPLFTRFALKEEVFYSSPTLSLKEYKGTYSSYLDFERYLLAPHYRRVFSDGYRGHPFDRSVAFRVFGDTVTSIVTQEDRVPLSGSPTFKDFVAACVPLLFFSDYGYNAQEDSLFHFQGTFIEDIFTFYKMYMPFEALHFWRFCTDWLENLRLQDPTLMNKSFKELLERYASDSFLKEYAFRKSLLQDYINKIKEDYYVGKA